MRLSHRITVATICGLLLVPTVTVAASASESAPDTLDALQAVTAQSSEQSTAVLDNVANVGTSSIEDNAVDVTINGVAVVVPSDSDSPIQIDSAQITLPTSAAGATEVLQNGVVEYSGSEGADTAVVVKDDGSVQIATVLSSEDAPESYVYDLALPDDVTWTETENGALLATDASGTLVLGVAPAWAVDANGDAVSTRYSLDGSQLTQIVEHRGDGYTYPIVADPWLGAAIFQATAWYPSTPKAVAVVSAWGSAIHSGLAQGGGIGAWAAGQAILKGAGWDELRGKIPAVNNKATYRQQYDCHVLGAYTPWTGGSSWDLEGWRSSNPNWLNNVANHKCNW